MNVDTDGTGGLPGLPRAREVWRRVTRAVGPRAHDAAASRDGLAELLDPASRVVPFTGREAELAELLEWCRAPHPAQVRLTTGAGGVGKTRLAVEAARRLARSGWRCVWVRPETEAARVLRDAAAGRRTLVIVDDAARRADLAALLGGLPVAPGARLRVLLLARTGREWWHHLRWDCDLWRDATPATSHTHLAPVTGQDEQTLVTIAARAFAHHLGTTAPPLAVRRSVDRPCALDLHAAALLAVTGAATGSPRGTPGLTTGGALAAPAAPPAVSPCPDGVTIVVDPQHAVGALLDGERGRWMIEAARVGLPTDDVDRAVAAGMLFGAATDDDAREALHRTAPVLATGDGVDWLRGMPALPHRLAERHVARCLTATPWFAHEWIRGLPGAAAHRVAVVLAGIQADAAPQTERAPVDAVLRRLAEEMPADAEALAAVLRLLPQPPELPGELAEVLTARILDLDSTPVGWADALTHRARALWTLGRHTEALQVASEAVAAWRALAAGAPRRYGTCLARALTGLGAVRHALGRYADALEVLTEALAILRTAPPDEVEWTEPELAATLRVLAETYEELGRHAELERIGLEEIAVLRRLVARDPAQFEAQLGRALVGRLVLVDHGRPLEALEISTEALALWRRLARRHAAGVEPQLARTLSARGRVLAELGRLEEGIVAETEALELRRHLAAAGPARFDTDLATSLARLGAHLSVLGRAQHAHTLETEALAIRRRLARENPRCHAWALASSLSNLGVTCSRLGRYAEALPLEQEALAIRRDLAREAPARYEQYLARSLSNLGVRHSDLGEPALAVEPTQEAVAILRRLAAQDPARYQPDLASACTNLGATYTDLGRTAEAADLLTESVALLRGLAATCPARFRPGLAQACSMLAALEGRLGRADAAVEHATEAVAIRRELVALHGDRYREDLETSLAVLSEACDPRTVPTTARR